MEKNSTLLQKNTILNWMHGEVCTTTLIAGNLMPESNQARRFYNTCLLSS